MEDKNTCVFKSVQKIENYLEYLLNEDKHKGQKIYHNNVLDKIEKQEIVAKEWKQKQTSKKGWVPKPLSLVLSFPAGIPEKVFISKAQEKLHLWFKKISAIDKLNLTDNDIESLVKSVPFVAHYKTGNPHVHFLVPKVLPQVISNKKSNVYINLYKFRYSNPLYKISGWSTKQKVINQQYQNKQKAKSPDLYLKDKLYNEIDHYRNLNTKLDKFIALIEKDIAKGHTDKAQKKIEKMRKKNGK
ncbi:MAG: hypothetical protein U9Q33_13485 [Campylobacterota bacterium]|nr:hypothetical protein [Campylobacterota bacterium]